MYQIQENTILTFVNSFASIKNRGLYSTDLEEVSSTKETNSNIVYLVEVDATMKSPSTSETDDIAVAIGLSSSNDTLI